jgi:hypothetical protein
MADNHTRDVFAWLNQVAADAELLLTAARLAIKLTCYFNRETGDAWPSVPRLADELSWAENTVRGAARALAGGGHLVIEPGGGRNATNRYRMVLKGERSHCAEVSGNEKPFNGAQGNDEKPFSAVQGFETETLQNRSGNPSKSAPKTLHLHEGEQSERTIEEPSERDSPPLPPASAKTGMRKDDPETPPAGFEDFWRVYPKRKGKIAAVNAYRRALQSGATPTEIQLGASRYSIERDREADPDRRERYTKDPATWLNGGHWTDEPSSAPALYDRSARGPGPRRSLLQEELARLAAAGGRLQ